MTSRSSKSATLQLASDLAAAPREIEVITSKNVVQVLILNDDVALENHDILNVGSCDVGNAILKDAGNESVELWVKNNTQRYTWEIKETTLVIYENYSIRARTQTEPTPVKLPFTPDVTRIRFVDVYPTADYQNISQTSGTFRAYGPSSQPF